MSKYEFYFEAYVNSGPWIDLTIIHIETGKRLSIRGKSYHRLKEYLINNLTKYEGDKLE